MYKTQLEGLLGTKGCEGERTNWVGDWFGSRKVTGWGASMQIKDTG